MLRARSPLKIIRAAAGPAIALMVVAMFAGYAVAGPNGLLRLGDYRRQIKQRQIDLASIETERARLANRKALIARGDPDIADEMVRSQTDMVGNDQYVVVTR
jgi:cell division protein FtsB